MIQQNLKNTSLNEISDSQKTACAVLSSIEEDFGTEIFVKWFAEVEVFSQSAGEVIFSAPSKFVRDWLIREFLNGKNKSKTILSSTQKILPQVKKVTIIHIAKDINEQFIQNPSNQSNSEQKIINLSPHDNIFTLGTELNPKFTFENFISAKYNKMASSMAKIAAGIDKQIDLFDDKIPLFIHGNVGMGKTHLAQAIAWQIKDLDKRKKVVYLSAEKFMYHFVQSIRRNDVMTFKEKMRSIDVLIVDDVQFIAGKESTQQEFMNCFNALVEENKQVVLVCDRNPNDLENIDEKLKSRITGGMIVNFKNPDYSDRLELLKAKSKQMGQEIGEKILSLIAEKVSSSIRDLEGILKKLLAQKVILGEEITIDSAKAIISGYIRAEQIHAITIEKIQKNVAHFYGIKISELNSSNRSRSIARPRQIAMYLAKKLTQESLPKIGKEFGGKNHATVIHSVKLIENLMNSDSKTLQEIKSIEESLAKK